MKVCFAIQHMSTGGSSTMLHDLIFNWPNKKDKLYLLVFFDMVNDRYKDLFNVQNLSIYFLHKSKTIDFKFLNLLKKTIFQIRPDVISSHLTTTFYLKLVRADKICKIYHTIHNEPNKDLPFLYRLYLKKSIKNESIKLIGCCNYITEKSRRLYKTNVISIRNGINFEINNNLVNHKKVNFIYIGRFTHVKNVDKVIRAFDKLGKCNSVLRIVGDGKLKNAIIKLIKKTNNKNIIFIGKTNNIDLYLRQSDVLCLTSKREGFPIVILESMKYNLSYIVSNVGGISEIIKNGVNGIIIDSINIEEIKNSMQMMFDKKRLNNYKINNTKLKKNISASSMALKYKQILN